MLIIERLAHQWVRIGDAWIGIAESSKGRCRLMIEAPAHVKVLREELVPAGEARPKAFDPKRVQAVKDAKAAGNSKRKG